MVDRRRFLQASVNVCGAAALASGAYVVARYLTPLPEGLGEQEVEIRDKDLLPGTAVQVLHKGKPVLVLRDQDGKLHALSAVCTHLGCLVKWNVAEQRIQCPCHNANFSVEGAVLGGPAPDPLPALVVGVVDGVIRLGGAS